MHFDSHTLAYVSILVAAAWGVFNVLLLWRQLRRRKFKNERLANEFVTEVRDHLSRHEYDEAEELTRSPQHWYTGLATLTRAAIERRRQPLGKLRGDLVAMFARDILTDLESALAQINMVVKCEPMLGLMGTVLGMIGAFSRIATIQNPSPQELMKDLSLALNCTALGLISCIPLLIIGNTLQIRIRRLEETTFGHLGEVLEGIKAAEEAGTVRTTRAR